MSTPNQRLRIRPAVSTDIPTLQALEIDGARAYGTLPATRFVLRMGARSDMEHTSARESGLARVAELDGAPVGFLLSIPSDGCAHILELSVALSSQGQGFGRRLLADFEVWAAGAGYTEATLTTFRDVPWNAPFYARLGFEPMTVGPDRPGLAEILRQEHADGIDRAPRVAMRKRL